MRAFVIRGFGVKKDSTGAAVDFDLVDSRLISPALARCGLSGGTTGEVVDAGNIRADMFALILEADVVVCDITIHNANVFYELGVRHALRKKHTVLIKGTPSADTTPFDLSTDRYLAYPVGSPGDAVDALVAAIQAGLTGQRETDSPIFLMMPTLAQADPSSVSVVPLDFIDEVQRAQASSDRGWLRLLADEVRGARFEREGLKHIGRAQWKLKDYDGARDTWEAVRNADPNDLDANLALSNILERLYRANKRPALLEASNQAIRAVLDSENLAPTTRAEALALQGRNLKTLWRLDFETLATPEERRARALDSRLMRSFEAYLQAFRIDLNSFYPGVAALQAGHILQSLSASPALRNLFGRDQVQAQRFREDHARRLAELAPVVATSIACALERFPADNEQHMWAAISDADLLFLTEDEAELAADPGLAIAAYRDAVPQSDRFDWDATRGQLDLFAGLGIREPVARAVMKALDRPAAADAKPVHLVVFSGHSVDTPTTPAPRFPATAEAQARARALIEARLRALQRDDEELVVLASAAPGADILVHELCLAMKLRCRLCLPMPKEVVSREVFGTLDDWRNRFLAVVQAREADALLLSDSAELPRWQRARGADPWERGNRWVVKLAQSWGAGRVTLLALWDQNEADPSKRGTAEMVRLARQTGSFGFELIDSRQLLAGGPVAGAIG